MVSSRVPASASVSGGSRRATSNLTTWYANAESSYASGATSYGDMAVPPQAQSDDSVSQRFDYPNMQLSM